MKAFKLLPLVLAVALAACGEKTAPAETPALAAEAAVVAAAPAAEAAAAPAPVAEAAPAAAAPAAGDLALGEKVYGTTCLACHGAGVLGAPKTGDKAGWTARVAKGAAALHKTAVDGVNMMPPRGGNPSLSDAEVTAAVDFMLSKLN